MLERFLEQQPAISAALLTPEVHRNEKELCTLKEEDITDAEDVCRALKPMKMATQVMSEEKSPTLLIAPIHTLLLKEMTSTPEDSNIVKEVKAEIKKNLSTRKMLMMKQKQVWNPLHPRSPKNPASWSLSLGKTTDQKQREEDHNKPEQKRLKTRSKDAGQRDLQGCRTILWPGGGQMRMSILF